MQMGSLYSQDRPELYFHKKIADSKFDMIRDITYAKPLMEFFHNCIDAERRIEINKQELVLSEDFCIYSVFKAMSGPGRKFLVLLDLYGILRDTFRLEYPFCELQTAVIRRGGFDQLRYMDWTDLMKPRAPEFADYVNKKI